MIDLHVNKVYPFLNTPAGADSRPSCMVLPIKQVQSKINVFRNDADFDWMYPEHIQLMSEKHWTPLSVAGKAAEFLAVPGSRILDIGSGIGKFCLTAAYHHSKAEFYGVEQRTELVQHAQICKEYAQLSNVYFIHANVTQLNFKEFDHFYFYNAFYENIDQDNRIDDNIETSYSLYAYYTHYLFMTLEGMAPGTRLVTYQCFEYDVPPCYRLVKSAFNNLLQMWIKT